MGKTDNSTITWTGGEVLLDGGSGVNTGGMLTIRGGNATGGLTGVEPLMPNESNIVDEDGLVTRLKSPPEPKIGQIWKRLSQEKYYRIIEYDAHYDVFVLHKVYGGDYSYVRRTKYSLHSRYEQINGIMCSACGTARARYNSEAVMAEGLECWSCYEKT